MKYFKTTLSGLIVVLMSLISGCGHSTDEVARIIAERDSLRFLSERQERRMNNLNDVLNIVNNGLDSIARSEDLLFVSSKNEGAPSRDDALRNIANLSELVETQKQKISALEKKLNDAEDDNGQDENLRRTIDRFRAQLAEKEREIASLKKQIEQNNVDISQLRTQVGSQARTIAELDRRNAKQSEALKRQDAMLNQCYVKIGDKKTLEQLGIVKKGKLVAQGALDRSKFSKVDIRAFTEVEFEAKRPRILTPIPPSAYEMTSNRKNHYLLRITNPTEFWKISNYLVIQTN